jgi:1-acyl-sn-glycerol-3-phosphate acyltransferase
VANLWSSGFYCAMHLRASSAAPVAAGSPTLRRLILWISARCLRWFYREQRVLHAERIPSEGPVLLIGNHPNDLPDVMQGFFVTDRPVRYLATVSAATSWLSRKTYAWLGVIPVARVRDARKMKAAGVDIVAVNRAATDHVAAAFAAGQVIGAFPEGGVRDVPSLAEFRTGVASMVLKYVDAGLENDVTIVPFGLQYEAPTRAGSDVVAVVGEPLRVRGWLERQPDAERGAAALTRRMHAMVSAVTRNSASREEAQQRDAIVAAVSAQRAPRSPLAVAPAVVRDVEGLADERLRTAASSLAAAVERAGGIGTSALDHAQLLVALDVQTVPAPLPTMVLWLGAPAAVLGWLTHGPLFALVDQLAHRLAKARADIVARMYLPGLYLVVLWYGVVATGLLAACVAMGIGRWWAVPVILLLPRFGDLAVGWRGWYRHWRLVRAAYRWSTPERMALREDARVVRAAGLGAAIESPAPASAD